MAPQRSLPELITSSSPSARAPRAGRTVIARAPASTAPADRSRSTVVTSPREPRRARLTLPESYWILYPIHKPLSHEEELDAGRLAGRVSGADDGVPRGRGARPGRHPPPRRGLPRRRLRRAHHARHAGREPVADARREGVG